MIGEPVTPTEGTRKATVGAVEEREPLWTDCEGSDCPTHLHALGSGICATCGSRVPIWADGKAKDHKRKDILAMLDRGRTP